MGPNQLPAKAIQMIAQLVTNFTQRYAPSHILQCACCRRERHGSLAWCQVTQHTLSMQSGCSRLATIALLLLVTSCSCSEAQHMQLKRAACCLLSKGGKWTRRAMLPCWPAGHRNLDSGTFAQR